MADPTFTLLEYLRKVGIDLDGDFLQEGSRLLALLAEELEAEQVIGAGRYERSDKRTTYRLTNPSWRHCLASFDRRGVDCDCGDSPSLATHPSTGRWRSQDGLDLVLGAWLLVVASGSIHLRKDRARVNRNLIYSLTSKPTWIDPGSLILSRQSARRCATAFSYNVLALAHRPQVIGSNPKLAAYLLLGRTSS
jgi:hypothetical protein